jgi:hypothetical protein
MSEKFENINGHKKGIKKNTDNDIYNITEKTNDLTTGIQLLFFFEIRILITSLVSSNSS